MYVIVLFSCDYSKLSGKFISQYRNFHRNMNTFNTKKLETKPNQLLHQPSPALPCQQKRIPTVTNIETDNNNKKNTNPPQKEETIGYVGNKGYRALKRGELLDYLFARSAATHLGRAQ